ncbi:MAG: hypothetical protein IPI66_03310 [Chitinophagaceae bacterium]|nr:hypothetical protein [Chitinophagaceae bacterium]
MKFFYPLVFAVLTLASCSSSKDYMSRIDEDKTLFDAVKALGKHADNSVAAKALPALYTHAREKHLNKISSYGNSTELGRWDKIINEYSLLQKMYDVISQTDAARRLVVPSDYQSDLVENRNRAAEDYYREAETLTGPGE